MSLLLKPGVRVFGAACSTEAIVIKAPSLPIDLRIGGHQALLTASDRNEGLVVLTSIEDSPAIGKRYADSEGALELLCTKAGDGAFAVGDVLCVQQDAKQLPSSD